MKRILLSFMVILMLSFASGAWAAPGDSPDNPIFISTPEQLDAVRNGLDKYYKLSNDIDLTAYLAPGGAGDAQWGAAGWAPIGNSFLNYYAPFTGGLDGNGNKITGIWIDRSDTDVGLFGYAKGAEISNLGVEIGVAGINGSSSVGGLLGYQDAGGGITNSYVTGNVSGDNRVGGLVGLQSKSSIENSYATGNVSSDLYVGGLVGYQEDSSIEHCYATGNVSGDNYVGGLVGHQGESSIENSYATGNVSGGYNVGGLVGSQVESSIENSYATGNVSSDLYVGGLVGESFFGSIENCYATGNVSGSIYVGGLAGMQSNGSIENCYATGNVRGGDYVGGFVGYQYNSSIEACYATGDVGGDMYVGGLLGYQDRYGVITNCYTTGDLSGNSNTGGLVGISGGTSSIINSYRYQFTTVNGTVIPASDPDSAPNRKHGGAKTAVELMTKTTYTDNSWLFDDSAPIAGPWHWDSKNFPKLNMGTESFPFPWDPLIPSTGEGGRESGGGKGGGCDAIGYGGYLAFALFGTAPLVLGKRQ